MPNLMKTEIFALESLLDVAEQENAACDDKDPSSKSIYEFSDDDIIHAPINLAEEQRLMAGVETLPSTALIIEEIKAIAAKAEASRSELKLVKSKKSECPSDKLRTPYGQPPKIVRKDIEWEGFRARLLEALSLNTQVLVYGSAGCGKSYFINQLFAPHSDVRKKYQRMAIVNCRALRIREPAQLARELIWAQFGLDEKGYQSFSQEVKLSNCGLSKEDRGGNRDPIYLYFDKRFPPLGNNDERGLVVLDHFGCFQQTPEMNSFLVNSLLPSLQALGLRVLCIQRNEMTQNRQRRFGIKESIGFPTLTAQSVATWLNRLTAHSDYSFSFSANDVLEEIGPRPELLDDFQMFLHNAENERQAQLSKFIFHRERLRHLVDCDRFIQVVREFPLVLGQLVANDGDINILSDIEDPMFLNLIEATGAVYSKEGRWIPMSRLHDRRLKALFSQDAIAAIAIRGTLPKIMSRNAMDGLSRFPEHISDAVSKALAREPDPAIALVRFKSFLRRLNVKSEIYIRDPGNSKLWAPSNRMDRLAPFRSELQPEFARAIQTGENIRCEDGRWLLPVHGNSGLISMVIRAHFISDTKCWEKNTQVRFISTLLGNIQITLSHILQRLAFTFERQIMAKTAILSRAELMGHNGLLQNFGCIGWSILDCTHQSREWYITKLEATGAPDDRKNLADMFGTIDNVLLNQYASHYSKRGVVLAGEKCQAAFPVLSDASDAVYIQPVSDNEKCVRVVVFVFDLKSDHYINGLTQKWLGALAPNLAA